MFADHPVVGVGYGNFEDYYHRYARTLALDSRREERAAHSLYLEVAAETGIVGMAAFALLLLHPIAGTIRTRSALRDQGLSRDAQHVVAFGIALGGYLVGSLFLHLSYPRYFWLLLGIAIAVGALSEPASRRLPQPVRATP
jgi:O-antigen ligase